MFCHFDVEADGPDPLNYSMISIGVLFTDKHGTQIGTFLGDMHPLKNHIEDPDTMDNFWNRDEHNRAELARIRKHARDPIEVMKDLCDTVARLLKEHNFTRTIWVAKPAAYDWQWLNTYWNLYLLSVPQRDAVVRLPFKAVCVSTLRDVWQYVNGFSRQDAEARLKEAAAGLTITHNPLDDCRCQAKQYFYLLRQLKIKL